MIHWCRDFGQGVHVHAPVCSWEFPGSLKRPVFCFFCFFESIFRKHAFLPRRAHTQSLYMYTEVHQGQTWTRMLLGFMAVQVFESFQFFNESFVLVLQNSHAVLQTLHVFLLLPAALSGCLPVETDGALISVY